MVWLKFIICVVVIFISGRKVARYGDVIAEKTGLGGVWIGLILIAALTSLPELFNGVSAITLVDAPGLTIGNILGANMFNLFNLALLDLFHRFLCPCFAWQDKDLSLGQILYELEHRKGVRVRPREALLVDDWPSNIRDAAKLGVPGLVFGRDIHSLSEVLEHVNGGGD